MTDGHARGPSSVEPEPRPTTPNTGLSADEVAQRVTRGQTNGAGERTGRTVGEILRANILTRFNLLLGTLLAAIIAVGQLQDALFGIVLVSNALIGIVQEWRAKRTLDRLAVLSAPLARVVRDGDEQEIALGAVVLDDLVSARTGDQVVADGIVRASSGLQVDESLLTGEAEPVDKGVGEHVLSGSFVVAGAGQYQAVAVGPDAYARQLTATARRFTPARSELVEGINRILRYVTWAIVPIAVLLLVSQLRARQGLSGAISGTVAGLVGMVPQGLVLLTSVAFAVAAVALARKNVLVQELAAIEVLARVDVICFDKTGTLTDGSVILDRVEVLDDSLPVAAALSSLANDQNANATLRALQEEYPPSVDWRRGDVVPFSSARKWSAVNFAEHGTWLLGAPEMVLRAEEAVTLRRAATLAESGRRVLVLAHSDAPLEGDVLPARLRAAALILLVERVRDDAASALAYFATQGVATKVISGDHPLTVAAIAERVGMSHVGQPVDARDLPEDVDALGALLEEHSVFGRVTPRQKQDMVTALQARGHTVAMTGDGVNDVLALKLADIGIAMGSGAPATRSVAQIVLLDGRFETMPEVVAAGRKVAANIERVANIFLVKTAWSTVLAVLVSVLLWPYPFLPRHLTIIDTLTIGVPAFFLALAPNQRRFTPGFVARVLGFALPTGVVVGLTVFAAYALERSKNLPSIEQRTGATLVALTLSLSVLVLVALPLTWRRWLIVAGVTTGFIALFPLSPVRSFYGLQLPSTALATTFLIALAGVVLTSAAGLIALRRHRRATSAVGDDRTAPHDKDVSPRDVARRRP
ncbi:MAG: HAD-IC family P-type ATPase [Actinomycetota bacterium]|nr:HAD-IC family P-type ATPase [Actinomycetota bacterium]